MKMNTVDVKINYVRENQICFRKCELVSLPVSTIDQRCVNTIIWLSNLGDDCNRSTVNFCIFGGFIFTIWDL